MCCNSHRVIRNAAEAKQYYSEKRRAAAVKGWQTRRANMGQGFSIVPDPEPVYRPAAMTFGGTLPVAQSTVKEIANVSA